MKNLSYGVMTYMLLALIWWTVLLTKNNNEIYLKTIELHRLDTVLKDNSDQLLQTLNKTKLHHERVRQMIIGEGIVFGLSLILGMWMIQKAYIKEVEQTQNQKNFLLSITHELKSPIAAIQLISETLLKRKIPTDQQSDLHKSILLENKRLENLINNLLLATKLESDYQYNFQNTDLTRIIHQCIERQFVTNANANIQYNYSESVQIMGDREALVSVFTNLIENGIKYGPPNPEIIITHKIIEKHVHISITDNGTGIPDVEKDKIFNQFYRLGNEETRKTKGTGLGLYITDKIVKAHKGRIRVDDNPDGGTIFTLFFPTV